jgi:cation:H+ antiporter
MNAELRMVLDMSLMFGCLVLILGACFLFSNAVEWLGKLHSLSHGVVGSIFAAVGTALPETIIPIIAILFYKGAHGAGIGIGAIAGAPFMLSTLAFFVTGSAIIVYTLLGKRTLVMNLDPKIVSKDLIFFIIIYSIAIASSFVHQYLYLKVAVAIFLIAAYVFYVRQVFHSDSMLCEEPEDFLLHRLFKIKASHLTIYAQLALGLVGIVLGAHYFIKYVEALSFSMGIAPLILSIIITPIATELPEKLNSVIWTGERKDTLALGNITGAMVFQSCIPVITGILFTNWILDAVTLVSAGIAILTALVYLIYMKLTGKLNPFVLLLGGIGYAGFITYVLATN